MGSLSPVNLDVGAALAQPQGWGGLQQCGLEVPSRPVVLMVFPASSRAPDGLGLLSGKVRSAQRPVFPSGAHFLNSLLPGILLDLHHILNLKLMLMVSKPGLSPSTMKHCIAASFTGPRDRQGPEVIQPRP